MNIQGVGREGSHPFSVELLIDGQKVLLSIDTGSTVTPISENTSQ